MVKDQYTYPKTAEVLRVTITPAMPAHGTRISKALPDTAPPLALPQFLDEPRMESQPWLTLRPQSR